MITPLAPLSRTVTRKIAPAVSRSVYRRRLPPITSLARRWPSMIRSRTSRRRADTFATVIRYRWTVLTSQRRCNRQTRHARRMGDLISAGQVPRPPERSKSNTVATATTSETGMPNTCSASHEPDGAWTPSGSLMEPLGPDAMDHLLQQRLIPRLTPPQTVESDLARFQVHLRTDQPVGPVAVHFEVPPQHFGPALGVRAPDVHHPALETGLEVQTPAPRERIPRRRCLDPIRSVASQRGDMASGPIGQGVQVRVLEPPPDPDLPGAVVLLDGRLEARLARRHEHRGDAQAQAQPADAPDHIEMDVRPLEDRIVVELGVARQAELPPMLDQALDHELRRDALPTRQGRDQAAMERDAVEDLDLGAAADDESLDDIDAVEFPTAAGHLRQIPAPRRRRLPDPMPPVQHAPTPEDAVDGPLRRQWCDPTGPEGIEDRLGPEESQVTLGLQSAPHLEDQIFEGSGGPLGGMGDRRTIGPIDPVEALAVRMADPAIDSGGAHAEIPCDLLLRSSTANGRNQRPTAVGFPDSLLMVRPSQEVSFQASLHRARSGGCGSWPFRRLWHLAPYSLS